jgi:Uma2 family endonuclease
MASTAFESSQIREFGSKEYPTRDGRPMGETDVHRNVMFETIETLKAYYAGQQVYVTGNLLVFYRPGDKRRHVSPDAMVVKGAQPGLRLNYLIWQEGHTPNVVIEITSPSTRNEDLKKKFDIYRTEMHVREYFLFDPKDEYLSPRLQGFRLVGDEYIPIELIAGRLESSELGLHLEASGEQLRFYDPSKTRWIPTLHELQEQAEEAQQKAEEENARLRREVEELRRRLDRGNS